MQRNLICALTSLVLCLNLAHASPDDAHGRGEGAHDEHGDHHGPKQVQMSPTMAERVGIRTAEAGPGTLAKTLTVYGEVTTIPGGVSHVRARFPGLITDVQANIGDKVEAGDVLARIESNESLRVYEVTAPIAGTVTERHANTGESTGDQVLFTVANLDRLWVNLKVFPSQRSQVSTGQTVTVSTANLRQSSTLRHLIPSSDGHPFITARTELSSEEGAWTPGLLVSGKIQTQIFQAGLVVATKALQTLDGEQVVFVKQGDHFTARPVTTGRTDGEFTEILAGLEPGEILVVENSYLIKADIEKSEAGHSH